MVHLHLHFHLVREPFHFTLHMIASYVCVYVLARNWQQWVVNKGGLLEDGKPEGDVSIV